MLTQATKISTFNRGNTVHQAENLVRKRPVESVAVAFSVGVVAGVLAALVLRSR